jgi:hypothetical protein
MRLRIKKTNLQTCAQAAGQMRTSAPLLLLSGVLLAACVQSAPPVRPPNPTPDIAARPTQVTHRLIIQFSRALDAQSPEALQILRKHSQAGAATYLRSLSNTAHLYVLTAPAELSSAQLLQRLRDTPGIRTVELDQKAFEQTP